MVDFLQSQTFPSSLLFYDLDGCWIKTKFIVRFIYINISKLQLVWFKGPESDVFGTQLVIADKKLEYVIACTHWCSDIECVFIKQQ